jgi:8-oxo-dGTP pyrophosphatase MutT (NUDIX family)
MYKIYINDTPLILQEALPNQILPLGDDRHLITRYSGAAKTLFSYSDLLEKPHRVEGVTIYSSNYEQLVADFFSNFQLIEAAGGVVTNEVGKVLVIFRRGSWDLPKGKIDAGETPEEAAVREVEEETGLQQLNLTSAITQTYHTYRDGKNRRILKRTYWYKMNTHQQPLIPQTEEDIEIAEWVDLEAFLGQKNLVVYNNIREVLEKH